MAKALEDDLGRYVRLAREGEVILVVDRDEVVAELRRPQVPRATEADRRDAASAALEAEGTLRPARGPGPRLADLAPFGPAVPGAATLLRETRDERF